MGPPTGGQDSDLENEGSEILNTKGLPEEITGEVEIFNIRNDEIEKITSDGEVRDVELPPAYKQKQNAKTFKINVKWQKERIQAQIFSSFEQDKNAHAVFLENPELVELMMWSSFEKLVSHLIVLLFDH